MKFIIMSSTDNALNLKVWIDGLNQVGISCKMVHGPEYERDFIGKFQTYNLEEFFLALTIIQNPVIIENEFIGEDRIIEVVDRLPQLT